MAIDPYADFASPVQAGKDPYEEFASPHPPEPGPVANMARYLAMGIPFGDRLAAIGDTLPGIGTGKPYAENLVNERNAAQALQQQHPVVSAVGSAVGAAPLMAVPGGGASTLGRIGMGALEGAGIGGVYGASSSPDLTSPSQTLPAAVQGAALGGAAGGVAGAVSPLINSVLGRGVTPLPSSGARQNAVDLLQTGPSEIPLSAGQITGRPRLQELEQQGVGFGVRPGGSEQAKAFTQGTLDRGGVQSPSVAQADLANASATINRKFDTLGGRNDVAGDSGLHKGVDAAVGEYNDNVNASLRAPAIQKYANSIKEAAPLPGPGGDTPMMSGEQYNSLRSKLTNKAYGTTDTDQASAYRDLRDALDSGMERSIAANNPSDLGAFKEARREYGNFQDVSKAAAKSTDVEGTISPQDMKSVLSSGKKAVGYASGKGDLASFTDAASKILKSPDASKGIPDYVARHIIAMGLGGGAGYYQGGNTGAILGAALAPKAIGSAARLPLVRNYLANQLMTKIPANSANIPALAAALAAQQGR